MAVMKKGANVSLTREVPGLTGVILGVNWDVGGETVLGDNLVMATLLCDADNKALSDEHFVFFNQLTSPDESVAQRDEMLGADDEQIEIDLRAVPREVERIVAVLYVNPGPAQRRTLGQLRRCVLRVLNINSHVELVASEDLAAGLGTATAMALGEVYRYHGEWKFKVLGDAYDRGIAGVLADYGLAQ